jgi:V/A-type H+/Na+-transporting ATPase subunit E
MSVEGIIEKILSDARSAYRVIVEGAEKEAESIRAEQKREAAAYFVKQKGLLDERYRKDKERAVLNKRLEMRKITLGTRQEWMEKAFADAYRRLVDQPLGEYKMTLLQMIGSASQSKDEEVCFGRKGDRKFFEEVIRELNGKTGGRFTLSHDDGNFPWGFILKKGKVEVNVSIDSLFKYRRADFEQKAWELFNADR